MRLPQQIQGCHTRIDKYILEYTQRQRCRARQRRVVPRYTSARISMRAHAHFYRREETLPHRIFGVFSAWPQTESFVPHSRTALTPQPCRGLRTHLVNHLAENRFFVCEQLLRGGVFCRTALLHDEHKRAVDDGAQPVRNH